MKYLLILLTASLAYGQGGIGIATTEERTSLLHKATAAARTSMPNGEARGRIVWQDSDNTLWLKNTTGIWEKFPDLDVVQAIQLPPTATGNTTNLNSIIKDANGKTYAIDSSGESMQLGGAEEIVDVAGATLPITFPVTTIPGAPVFTPATPAMSGMTYAITDGISLVFAKWNGTQYISAPAPVTGWGLFGNGGTTQTTNFVGTTDNVGLSFRTNNIIRATVTAGGNVGIGTTAPSVPLHVNRGSSGEIIRMQSTGNNSFMSWFQGGTRSGYWGDGTAADDRIQLVAEKAGGLHLASAHASGDIRFSTAGTDRGMWLDNGNFGVGTLSPTTRHHITTGTANDSGLRLENLTSASPTTAGQAIGVDATGKVVTVAAAGANTAGNGLQLTGTVFSALIDPVGDPALSVSPAGIKLVSPVAERLHPLAEYYGGLLGDDAVALPRISAALQILEEAGILGNLVDGGYYGTDGNVVTGMPLSLRGIPAAAMTGSFARTLNGLVASQSDIQGIGHDVVATNSGTMFVCATPNYPSTGFPAVGPLIGISETNATTESHIYCHAASSVPRYNSYGPTGAFLNQSAIMIPNGTTGSDYVNPLARQSQIHGATYGYSSHASWLNGIRGTLSGATFAAATANAKTRISLFRRPASESTFGNPSAPNQMQYIGTINSWMLFNIEITNIQAKAVNQAMIELRGTQKYIVVEGDSTSDIIFGGGRDNDNWGHLLVQNPAWADYQHLNCAESGHQAAGIVSGNNFGTQSMPLRPMAGKPRRAIYALSAGINDIMVSGATTAAQIYANLLTLTARAKKAGYVTVISTVPMPASSWQALNGGTNGTRLTALNTLIVAGHAAGDFDYLCNANTAVPPYDTDATKWFDTIHPNASGNQLWANAFASSVVP